MKKISILLLTLATAFSMQAQNNVGTSEQLKKFAASKTYVVLDQSMFGTAYNEKIQQTMEKHWTLTEFEFINRDQYAKLRTNPDASFIAKTEVRFKNDKQQIVYQFLSVMMGQAGGRVTAMPDLASFPLSYKGGDENEYVHKLGTILIFLQEHIKLTRDNPDLTEKNIIKHYNKQTTKIHNKTLYLLKEELSPEVNTEAKIKAIYPYPFKIVEKSEIEKAIADKDESVVFLHKVGPFKDSPKKERCYKTILGASNAWLYYWDMHKINAKKPDGMLKKDFKKLSK